MFAGFQFVAKIKRIEAAGHAHGIQLRSFDGKSPGTRPRQRAKPDFAVLFGCNNWPCGDMTAVAGNRKPRIGLMPGGSAPAFDDALSGMNGLLIQRPLS